MVKKPRVRAGLRLVAVLGLVALCLGAGANAAGRVARNQQDLRGVWDAPSHVGAAVYPQHWHITAENLATGAFSGVDTSPAGNFTIVGQVSGSQLTATVSRGSYVSHGRATVSGNHASGTFVDSNGTKGTFTMTRLSGPPTGSSTPPANPDQSAVCVGGCPQGIDLTYDPSLVPGQTSDVTYASCSSGRTTAGARAGAEGDICGLFDSIQDIAKDITSPALTTEMQRGIRDILNQMQTADPGNTILPVLQQELQQMQQNTQQLQQMQQQLQKAIEDAAKFTQSADSGVQAVDSSLAGDFPADDRTTASGRADRQSGRAAVNSALVVQSIAATHPSAAAAGAFTAAVKLATSTTASPARAQARFTLALAFVFGRRVLALGLKGSGPAVVLAQTKANVKAHRKQKLILTATPLGARVLRFLEVGGLRRKVSVQLRATVTRAGKTSSVTRSIAVK